MLNSPTKNSLDSMKHYSTYQSQFIEMFGTGTPKYKVSDICEVKGGSTPSRTNTLFWDNGDVPWFTVEDIYTQGKYIRETKQHITKLATKKCFVYPKDTVVICCTASIGECALAKIEMASNQQFNGMIIKDRSKLDPQFLLYVSSTLKDDLLRQAGKTTIHFVSRTKLEEMLIPVPTMDKQQRFVTIMDQADKSKFTSLKSQFIEMFGNPVTNDKNWETMPMKDIAPEVPSTTKLSGSVWLLNLDMIESHSGQIIEKVYEDDSKMLSVAPFDTGNVLYSKLRPYLNKVVVPDESGYATTELVPLRPNPKKLNSVFLSHLLRGDNFVNYANSIATGTKMPRMPLGDLRKFKCILPPMNMQLHFVEIAEQADKSKYIN